MAKVTPWEKANVFCTILALVVAILAVVITGYYSSYAIQKAAEQGDKANALTQQNLELQNLTSNFEPYLLPYYVTATVGDLYTSMPLDSFGRVVAYGSLNISVVAITPHAAVLNFSEIGLLRQFNVTETKNADWLNASNFFGLTISVIPWLPYGQWGNQFFDYKPQAFVQPGVTLVNFTIPIYVEIPLNQTYSAHTYGANLGKIEYEIYMYDVQLQKNVATYLDSATILANINP